MSGMNAIAKNWNAVVTGSKAFWPFLEKNGGLIIVILTGAAGFTKISSDIKTISRDLRRRHSDAKFEAANAKFDLHARDMREMQRYLVDLQLGRAGQPPSCMTTPASDVSDAAKH
jgi:hypothetical protein